VARRTVKIPRWLQAARVAGTARTVSPTVGKPDWLARALGRVGLLGAEEIEPAIRAGRVRIGSEAVLEPLTPLRPGDEISVDGARVSLDVQTLALAFNKPAGLVTAGVDPEKQGTVFECLRRAMDDRLRRFVWHAIGRLDRDTTGLLLFTNDERLVAHVASPATHLPKRYVAHVEGAADDAILEPLRRGIVLHDGPTRPAIAWVRAPGVVELTLTEGRHHQVKRMLAKVGLPVTKLHREAIGELVCDVATGASRPLTTAEIRDALRWPA
jgi:pseudouridine synthase